MAGEQTTSSPAAAGTAAAADTVTVVKERYEINFGQPLAWLDSNSGKAYAAKDKTNPKRDLFALICGNQNPPRLSMLPYLKSIDHAGLLKLVEFGVVDEPGSNSRDMALIYRVPGPRVIDFKPEDESIRTDFEKFKSLLLSMIGACESLRGYNLTHRAIRLDNLFYRDNNRNEIILGDCAATFPALLQPPAYETIESLLCLPEGRGNGSNSDDIYAIGAAMLGLIQQGDPAAGLTAPEMLRQKIKKGSYAALSGTQKVNNLYVSVLRAMLNDCKEARWNYLQIYNQMEGKANTFGNAEGGERSMRALTVDGEKYYTPQTAAIALLHHPEEGMTLLKNGKLQEWIKNGLENEKLSQRIDKTAHLESTAALPAEQAIGQICIMLDYTLPLKAGPAFVFPDGISKAVFHGLRHNQSLKNFYDLLGSDLIKQWYQEQPQLRAPVNANELKAYINRRDLGYGIERIMYDFDEDLPCISRLMGDELVNSPAQVLRALDRSYEKFKDQLPYDRSVIAYLRSKMGKKIDGILTDLNARQDYLQCSAVIRLYANIQNKYGPVQLLNLTNWLLSLTKPVINSYHNLKFRRYLEKELVKTAKNGKIIELYELLENEEAKAKDRSEYSQALKEINLLSSERDRIVNGGAKLDEEARQLAYKTASLLAVSVMLLSFVINLLHWVIAW